MKACVTGGSGYVGLRLGKALLAAGYDEVLLLDVAPPSEPLPPGLAFAAADVRDAAALRCLFSGALTVFHLASHGMSGGAQLQRQLVEAVNVGGTRTVLSACTAAAVQRFVYLSTYNVVFGGQRIEGGDETLPYFPAHRHPDAYSRTKAEAEMAALAADGTPLAPKAARGGAAAALRTCALRPAGIYGPGEQRHLPRIVSYLERGLFCFTIGGAQEAVVDWVHVDNLVQACVLAAAALGPERQHVAAGQAYFIHDDWPGIASRVNNFAFLQPLVEGLGYRMPRLAVPLPAAYAAAWLLEAAHALLLPLFDLSRLFMLTRAEVLKAGRTHWFSVDKARRELRYRPQRYDWQPIVQWFLDRGHGRPAQPAGKRRRRRQRRALRLALAAAALAAAFALLLRLLPAALNGG